MRVRDGRTRREVGTEATNTARAAWAKRALATLQRETGLTDADGLDVALTDLLTDLMHLCDQYGLEFDRNLLMAKVHYSEETSDTSH
jgi:hypothetical protein